MEVLKQGFYSGNVVQAKSREGITACVTRYTSNGFNNLLHCHENAHFSFMIDGGCTEKKHASYEILPGNITYYSAGEKHQVVKIAQSSRRINVELEERFFGEHQLSNEIVRSAIHRNIDAKFLMVQVYKELITNDALSEVSIQMLLLQLVGRSVDAGRKDRLPIWASVVDDYLHDALDEHVSLKDLALLAKLHPVTLSKQFPVHFRCTIGQYKRKLKIEKSLTLIKSTSLSLTEIALECGFYDQNHFIRTFKQTTGLLPSAYRKS